MILVILKLENVFHPFCEFVLFLNNRIYTRVEEAGTELPFALIIIHSSAVWVLISEQPYCDPLAQDLLLTARS